MKILSHYLQSTLSVINTSRTCELFELSQESRFLFLVGEHLTLGGLCGQPVQASFSSRRTHEPGVQGNFRAGVYAVRATDLSASPNVLENSNKSVL